MNAWPEWLVDSIWTATTIAVVYLIGYTLQLVIGSRLARLASRTAAHWDDVLIGEIKRRMPLWSLLVGLHLSLPRWPIAPETHLFATRVLSAIGVASVTFLVATVFARMAVDYGSRATHQVSGLTQNVVRIVVTLLGALVIVRSFGYDITPMLTVLGVGGLTVALALQEPLSNLFAGLFVSLAGQTRIGDYVRLDNGAEGYVVDFNWRSTRLRQLGDNLIEVPNSKLAQAVVTNYTQPAPDMGIGVDVTVDAGSDLEQVERVALDVAKSVVRDVPGTVRTAEPSVRFSAFTDTGVRFSVGLRAATFVDQFLVRHELIKRLHARLAAEGIALADVRARIEPRRDAKTAG